MIRIIGALMLGLFCTGCVSEHHLPASTVESFGFAGASAQIMPKALINDTEIENAAAAAAGIDPRDGAAALAFAGSQAGKDAVNQRVAALVAAAFDKTLRPRLVGPRPVKIDVAIDTFDVPSAVRKVLIGGQNAARAVVTLRDGVTGEVILTSPPFYTEVFAGQGLIGVTLDAMVASGSGASETGVQLAAKLASVYSNWLLKR